MWWLFAYLLMLVYVLIAVRAYTHQDDPFWQGYMRGLGLPLLLIWDWLSGKK